MDSTGDEDIRRSWERDLRDRPAAQAAAIRSWAGTVLADLDEDFLADVALVIEELLANAYEHGRTPRRIRLIRQGRPPVVRVEVEDNCAVAPVVRERTIQPRGWGMRLVDRLSKDWGFETATDGGKTVWAVVADPALTGERYGEVNTASGTATAARGR